MVTTHVGSGTHVGLVRSHNEDAYLIGQRVWAVADGMGGHAAGDVASAIAVERLADLDTDSPIDPLRIGTCIRKANADVLAHGLEHPATWGLGTTVAGVCEVVVGHETHWAVFNVGDSRVYRYWAGELARATVDHSETEELILRGEITEAQARSHHLRNVITRSVGTTPAPQADVWVLPQSGGERFLICSDGLSSELADSEIADLLAANEDPTAAADALIAKTLAAGARDNVTVIVVDVDGEVGAVEPTSSRQEG